MNTYEMTFIVRPDLDEDGTRGAVEQVLMRLQQSGADIIATLPWNPPRRRMAYPIKDFGDGFYVTTAFHLDPQAIRGVENALKLNDRILRYLLVEATALSVQQMQQRLAQQQAAAQRPPQPAEGAPATPAQATPAAPASAAPASGAQAVAEEPVTEVEEVVEAPAMPVSETQAVTVAPAAPEAATTTPQE